MSQRPPRPRAFRLDDRRIAVDDQPAPYAPEAVIRSQHEPIPAAAPALIDETELEIEAAQKSGLIARSRFSLARLAWTGLGGLVSLALGLWATNLIEGLFAKAETLGIIGAHLRPGVPGRPHRRCGARNDRSRAPDTNCRDACRLRQRPRR